jgi:predicted  nucleic acid-binding Zn-ribbon protein
MKLTELLAWVASVVLILGGISWYVIRFILNKSFEELEENRKRIIELEKNYALLSQSLGGAMADIVLLREMTRKGNEVMAEVAQSIRSFDANMKIWHKDISTQNAELKMSMDRSNNLVEQANRTNAELMGVLKEMRK